MSCVRCGKAKAPPCVALTPNVHEPLCDVCSLAWVEHAKKTLVARNSNGAVLAAFRRWCTAKEAA